MKATRYLLLLPLLTAFVPVDWPIFTVDEHLTMRFPSPPTEIDLVKRGLADKMPLDTRVFMLLEGSEIYQIVHTRALTVGAVDPAERQKFYDGVVTGLVTNAGGTLLQRVPFITSVGEGVDIRLIP